MNAARLHIRSFGRGFEPLQLHQSLVILIDFSCQKVVRQSQTYLCLSGADIGFDYEKEV